jgi:Tfp pilus assembly protein PilO
MSRIAWLLTVLVGMLLLVLWWFLLWAPTAAEIDSVREETLAVESQTVTLRNRAAELRRVRERAPEAAAELAAADVLVPRDAALPSLLRQLQQAADDAGVRLTAVSPSRPAARDTSVGTVSAIQLGLTLEGTYFQVVDFTRRLEDPMLSGRGVVWTSLSLSRGELPSLNAQIGATVFTRGEVAAVEAPELADDGDGETDEDTADDDGGETADDEEATP